MFKGRSTGEILVMAITFTVCTYVLGTGILVVLLAFFTDRDVSAAARNIADVINTMIGLLAGFLAGRTDVTIAKTKKTGEREDQEE
jgi:hypothetical protein